MPGSADIGSTIEEAVKAILGFGLGATGPDGAIDPTVRPIEVQKPTSPPWLLLTHKEDKLTAGWSPGKTDGKLTFWRKMAGTHIEWVEIELAGGSGVPAPSITNADTGASGGTLTKLRDAWVAFARDVPGLMGPGKVLDPQSLLDAQTMFTGAAEYFEVKHNQMTEQIAHLNRDDSTFRGSASAAFVQRVGVAMVKVAGALDRVRTWNDEVTTAITSAQNFRDKLNAEIYALMLAYEGALLVPQNFVIKLLNGAALHSTYSGWNSDQQTLNKNHSLTSDGVVGGQDGGPGGLDTIRTTTPTIKMSFPDIPGYEWDVFDPASWVQIDQKIRELWGKKMLQAFPDTLAAAPKVVADFQAAAAALRPPKIQPNPKMVPPKPDPKDDLGGNGGGGGGDSGLDDALNKFGDGLNNGLNGIGDGLNNLGNGLGGGLDGLGDKFGNGLNGLGDNLGNGLDGLGDNLGNGLDGLGNNLGDGLNGLGNDFGDGLNGLGNNLGDGLNGLGNDLGGGLDGLGGGLTGLGTGLNGLGNNLLGGGPDDLGSGLNGLGNGLGDGAQNLGDLSPQQLGALQDSGLLDNIPLTPEQLADLQEAGIPASIGSTLGDLTPEQLSQLQQDGLLDGEPLTPADEAALQAAGLAVNPNGPDLGSLGNSLNPDSLGSGLPSTQFPTAIDGVDVSTPGTGTNLPGFSLGNVSQPLAHNLLGGATGISTGGLQPHFGGAGGLGLGGGGGGLGANGLGTLGSSGNHLGLGGNGHGNGLGHDGLGHNGLGHDGDNDKNGLGINGTNGSDGNAGGFGGMPMMPPMGGMGGGLGGSGNEKSRERSTWLTEDEDVWGTDPDCAPAVIGRGDDFDASEQIDRPTVPEGPRPARPGRNQPVRRGQV